MKNLLTFCGRIKRGDESVPQNGKTAHRKPKVLFADSVTASKSSILVGEMAKLLKQNGMETGQNRFFETLREKGYLIKRKGTDYNMPTQKAMELGLFEIKETVINHSDGHTSVNKTPNRQGPAVFRQHVPWRKRINIHPRYLGMRWRGFSIKGVNHEPPTE